MKTMQPKKYTTIKKLICDWTDEKNYLIHYRILKFYVRHGMIVDTTQETIPFKQSKWLKKKIYFNTEKRKKAKHEFEKEFYKLLNNAFFGKTLENKRNRLRLDFIKKEDYKKIIKQQFTLTFNGIQKS